MQGFFPAAVKLQLVAEPKTALLMNQLVADYAELLLKILASLLPLQGLRADIAICNDLYEQAQVEVKRILAEMTKFNESAQTDGLSSRPFSALLIFSKANLSFTHQSEVNTGIISTNSMSSSVEVLSPKCSA